MNLIDFKLTDSGTSIVKGDIQRFEQEHSLLLPSDYKEMVLEKFNGGHLPLGSSITLSLNIKLPKGYVVREADFDIFELYPLERLEPSFYPYYVEQADREDEIREKYKDYLSIGSGMNCEYMLGVGKKNFGQVFLWIHHHGEENNPNKISNNFVDFIDAIQLDPEEELFLDAEAELK